MSTDIKDWSIVQCHGRTMLGKLTEASPPFLSPAYDVALSMQLMPTPGGRSQLAISRTAWPVFSFSSIETVTLPPDFIRIAVSSLSRSEQRELSQAVDQCEQMIQAMRAKDAGLVLPSSLQ